MNSTIFKRCSCGQIYPTELDVFKLSIPCGLQETMTFQEFDLELRICPRCGTCFSLLFPKQISQDLQKRIDQDLRIAA